MLPPQNKINNNIRRVSIKRHSLPLLLKGYFYTSDIKESSPRPKTSHIQNLMTENRPNELFFVIKREHL